MDCEAGHRLVLAKAPVLLEFVFYLVTQIEKSCLFVCFKLMGVLLACMPVHQMCVSCPQRLEERTRCPETGVTDI